MQSNITTNNNNGQPIKKLWATPVLTLIGSNTVNGGPQSGLHEKSITASSPTVNGFGLKGPFGTGTLPAAHTKHHYYS
ncbi:hypothetical protein ACFGVR_10475 [Mucilaginibacter sp. AW1-3]